MVYKTWDATNLDGKQQHRPFQPCVSTWKANFNYKAGVYKNAIGRVKHHKAGAARADNGPVVYKKVGKIAKTWQACLLQDA